MAGPVSAVENKQNAISGLTPDPSNDVLFLTQPTKINHGHLNFGFRTSDHAEAAIKRYGKALKWGKEEWNRAQIKLAIQPDEPARLAYIVWYVAVDGATTLSLGRLIAWENDRLPDRVNKLIWEIWARRT